MLISSSSKRCTLPDKRGTKRPADALDHDTARKRLRQDSTNPRVETSRRDPIDFWAREGQWPREYFELDMEHILARKKSLGRKRSNSATSTTPSDQKPREEKSAPYRDSRYETLLETKGSFMVKSNLDVINTSKILCRTLLEQQQTAPENSLFRDDIFESTCEKIHNRNEARVIQDITRLIVPRQRALRRSALNTSTS